MIDPQLAALSDTLFSFSVGVYSLAVLAFCAELAFGVRPVPSRELVAAGGGRVDGGGPVAGGDGGTVTGARSRRARRWGLVAMVLTAIGVVLHAGVLLTRGLATGRVPWGNMYEFATGVVLVAVVVYLGLAVRTPALRHIGVFVLVPVVLAMVGTGLFLYAEAGPLVAALRSSWIVVHVSTAIIGSGIFLVSGVASLMYLVRARYEAKVAAGRQPVSRIVHELPTAAALDRAAHRTAVFGFPLYTFAMIAGAIWAESAWGRFWGWDPKETWMFISWVVYAAYLHARTTAGWRGARAAWINIVGFAVVVFNLLYVNLVSTGLHSYGGVG